MKCSKNIYYPPLIARYFTAGDTIKMNEVFALRKHTVSSIDGPMTLSLLATPSPKILSKMCKRNTNMFPIKSSEKLIFNKVLQKLEKEF